MFVNVLLLSIVKPHESFDRFDHALRVANEIPIHVFCGEAISHPREKAGLMNDFPMCPAHGFKAMGIHEEFG